MLADGREIYISHVTKRTSRDSDPPPFAASEACGRSTVTMLDTI